jgi:hypothetical protein
MRAMAAQMTQMSMRLFGNPYFRSIDSLFALATYRLSAIIEFCICRSVSISISE